LLLVLFVIPEDFSSSTEEYIYLDLPEKMAESYYNEVKDESENIHFVDSEEALRELAESEGKFGAVVYLDSENQLSYRYYMQGYESERLKNLYSIINNDALSVEELQAQLESQEVRTIEGAGMELSDRENMLPVFLTFNGSLMGLFMIASYIFLDRQEGIIQAYAVTPAPIWNYLLSKVGVIITTAIGFSLIILLPTVGLRPNYGMLIVFLICSGFFATSLGLLITSYYRDLMQSFGALYMVIMVMVVPNIAYFVPSWEPSWIKIIPTYYMLESFKEIVIADGNMLYVLFTSAGFLGAGVLLFAFANYRFKKTLLI
jgi:ABC-2 type transport system permease protein